MATACRSCTARAVETFFRVSEVPVHSNRLFDTASEALGQKTGRIELGFCPECGFIQNSAFDPDLVGYEESYEDSQGASPLFRDFASALIRDLIREYDLEGKRILEIGCGQGSLLMQLCEAAGAEGTGFDPAYRGPEEVVCGAGSARFVPSLYGPDHADLRPDFVFFRHTLEHIADVDGFLGMLRANLAEAVPVYVEVPEASRILREVAFWDVYYEHASYFTAPALDHALRRHGFEPRRVRVGYRDQYLMTEARAGAPTSRPASGGDGAREVGALCRAFEAGYRSLVADWSERLRGWRAAGGRVVLWGAGSKSVGFLTALRDSADVGSIAAIVDINRAKQGSYQAGTDLPIVAPEDLVELRPDVVIVMNPIYRDEIRGSLVELGLEPEVLAL